MTGNELKRAIIKAAEAGDRQAVIDLVTDAIVLPKEAGPYLTELAMAAGNPLMPRPRLPGGIPLWKQAAIEDKKRLGKRS